MRSLLPLLVAAAATGLLAWALWPAADPGKAPAAAKETKAKEPAPTPAPGRADEHGAGGKEAASQPAKPAAAVVGPAPKADRAPATDEVGRHHQLQLPDGTFVPSLNDTVDPRPLQEVWGSWPWSPIVGTMHEGGLDWYVHQDNSRSTTEMRWRADIQRKDAMTRAMHPVVNAPPADKPAAGSPPAGTPANKPTGGGSNAPVPGHG